MALTSRDDLRTIYREAKELDHHCVNFLAKSPFMVLSTADENGVVDGSPKGGEPGFARVLADGRVGWADSSGNNRLDSFENVVRNPSVAMLFMIPGLNETLRINGTAELLTDPELGEQLSLGGRPAKVVVAVTVEEAYMHCAKAFRRASLWEPDTASRCCATTPLSMRRSRSLLRTTKPTPRQPCGLRVASGRRSPDSLRYLQAFQVQMRRGERGWSGGPA